MAQKKSNEGRAILGNLLGEIQKPVDEIQNTPLDNVQSRPNSFKSPGRPISKEHPNGKISTSARIDETVYLKAKRIAHENNLSVNDLLDFALREIISEYEEKHGEIEIGEVSKISVDSLLGR